jgi:hypothetical protein
MDLVGQRRLAHDTALNNQKRMAILAGGLQVGDCERTGGASLVFHDHRLAPRLLQAFREQPCQRVGGAAGWPAYYEADRFRWPIILSLGRGNPRCNTDTDRQGVSGPSEVIVMLLHVLTS